MRLSVPCGGPHASIALSGSQTNSFSVRGGLLLACSNLRSRGLHEFGPLGLTLWAGVCPRQLLGLLAVTERHGLIAKEGPPRLRWPSARCSQVARYVGLRDPETEHEKLAVDPWHTPEKSLTGHPCDQTATSLQFDNYSPSCSNTGLDGIFSRDRPSRRRRKGRGAKSG
jgi:hypothetical protein